MTNEIYKEIIRFLKIHSKEPTRMYLKEKFNISSIQLDEHLKQLEKKGLINLVNKQEQKPTIKKNGKTKEKVEKIIHADLFLLVVQIVFCVIGFIATLASIYYTTLWFLSFVNLFWSLIFSIAMILFSVCTFQLIIWFYQNGKYINIPIFLILWIIVVLFSMSSTLAGQYRQEYKKNIKQHQAKQENKKTETRLKLIKQQKSKIVKELEYHILDRKKVQENLNDFDKKERKTWRYEQERRRLANITKKIKKLQKKLDDLNKKIYLNIDTVIFSFPTFFEEAGDILGISSNLLRFFLSLFPAIFFDIIAPLSFSVILLVRKNGRN